MIYRFTVIHTIETSNPLPEKENLHSFYSRIIVDEDFVSKEIISISEEIIKIDVLQKNTLEDDVALQALHISKTLE